MSFLWFSELLSGKHLTVEDDTIKKPDDKMSASMAADHSKFDLANSVFACLMYVIIVNKK